MKSAVLTALWGLLGSAQIAWAQGGGLPTSLAADNPLPSLETGALSPEIEERLSRTEDLVLNRQPNIVWSGYFDFGAFLPSGDGSGFVQDFGHARFPQYQGRYGWVFLGDILSPAVNSRGEVADLGTAPGTDRFDTINSRGAPGFLVNEANVTMRGRLSGTAVATVSVNLTPRTGNDFRLGDSLDVDLAQVEWLPTQSQRTSLFIGKMESVLGIEYRERKAVTRFGITPTLLARYTTGTALGLKFRTKFGAEDQVVLAGAVTNGSNTTEQFHFYSEIDTNAAKTVSGRLSLRLPLPFSLEVGASGSWGAQDRASGNSGAMWFVGPDLLAHLGKVDLKAAWMRGQAPGSPLEDVYGLQLAAAGYVELNWMLNGTFGLLGRAEYRDAKVWLGDERLYLTKSYRVTVGARVVLNERVVFKIEALKNGEYGGLPQVANDILTSSAVFSY